MISRALAGVRLIACNLTSTDKGHEITFEVALPRRRLKVTGQLERLTTVEGKTVVRVDSCLYRLEPDHPVTLVEVAA